MNRVLIIVVMGLLSSCASLRYGNLTHLPQGKATYLAQDAVSQIKRIYPPARNTFRLSQRVCDRFGLLLIEKLRKQGYGVIENIKPRDRANFYYLVDETSPSKVYRLSLFISRQTLSRVYINDKGKLKPISPWSHKE